MVAVVFSPDHAERVHLVEQVVDRSVVFVLAIALEDAERLSIAELAHFLQAHGKPAEDGVVQLDRSRVVSEHAGDGLPILAEQALLLAVVLCDEQEVAHEVGRYEWNALRVEAFEDDGSLALVVELGCDDEQRFEALPKRHRIELVVSHLRLEVPQVLNDVL